MIDTATPAAPNAPLGSRGLELLECLMRIHARCSAAGDTIPTTHVLAEIEAVILKESHLERHPQPIR